MAKYPYVFIRFVGCMDMKATHASVRTKKEVADLSTNAGMNVGTFETRHKDAFGIEAELCYAKNGKQYRSIGEHNSLSLNEFNDYAKSKGGSEILKTHPEWF